MIEEGLQQQHVHDDQKDVQHWKGKENQDANLETPKETNQRLLLTNDMTFDPSYNEDEDLGKFTCLQQVPFT